MAVSPYIRQADSGRWGTIGGSVEVDEHPAEAAVREAAEEAGVQVELTRLLTALGGPEVRLTYPNGDQTAYVSIVYEAQVVAARPDPIMTRQPASAGSLSASCRALTSAGSPAACSVRWAYSSRSDQQRSRAARLVGRLG